jgi:NADPH:quinone reductase-like Zn-dependent oxidoreductase
VGGRGGWEMDGIGQDRLELRKAPVPEPRLGEVLVKVGAVSLNDRDKMVIESGRGLPLDLPSPDSDLVGAVVAPARSHRRGGSDRLGIGPLGPPSAKESS